MRRKRRKSPGFRAQAFSKWRPLETAGGTAPAVAALAAATDLLDQHVIPAVVRRPAAALGAKSLYELASERRYTEVRDAVQEMFDLRRVQP